MQPRISQRQSLACRECTRKKRKCSKEIPCARCKRLGLACDREVVHLRRFINQNGREIAFLDSLRHELQSTNPIRVSRAVQRLAERIEFLQSGRPQSGGSGAGTGTEAGPGFDGGSSTAGSPHGSESRPTSQGITSPPYDVSSPPDKGPGVGSGSGSGSGTSGGSAGQDSLIVTALEHLAWGRNSGSCFPHRHCACQYNTRSWPGLATLHSPYPQPFQLALSPLAASVSEHLPDRALSEALVRFHIDHISWHHNCLHAPTFLEQCRLFWDTGECDQLQWLALYCSVLSTTQFCLLHSSKYSGVFSGLVSEPAAPQSSQSLFQLMLDILHESQFLQNVSLYAVQAVVISTEVAHNIGFSQLNATLFASAIRIAECLGVHKIEDDRIGFGQKSPVNAVSAPVSSSPASVSTSGYGPTSVPGPSPPPPLPSLLPPPPPSVNSDAWQEMIEREVGRRVWLQMVIQDNFAMPFTDTYGIHPQQYSTGRPQNCDADLVVLPDDVPTISSYVRVLGTIACLMPELADGMGPLRARKPVHEQYEHILAMDQKMRQVVRAIPPFLLQQDPVLEAQISWLGIARQSLAITAAEKTPIYAHTRRTCVSAAMTILREHRNITESGEVSLWTHTAFCITAALLLSFEVLCYRTEDQDQDHDQGQDQNNDGAAATEQRAVYNNAILYARQYLAGRAHDVLAQRGVLLIDTIFPGMPGTPGSSSSGLPPSTTSFSFEDIASKFTLGWAILGLNSEMQQQQQQHGQQQHQHQYQHQQPLQHQIPVMSVPVLGPRYPVSSTPPLTHPPLPPPPPPPPSSSLDPLGTASDYVVQDFPQSFSSDMEDFNAWFQRVFSASNVSSFG